MLAAIVATYDAANTALAIAEASAVAAARAAAGAASSATLAVQNQQQRAADIISSFLADKEKKISFSRWIVRPRALRLPAKRSASFASLRSFPYAPASCAARVVAHHVQARTALTHSLAPSPSDF
jgi:hypothetical protein